VNKYSVTLTNGGYVRRVEAEFSFARSGGDLTFYNRTQQPIGTVATFAAGAWAYFEKDKAA